MHQANKKTSDFTGRNQNIKNGLTSRAAGDLVGLLLLCYERVQSM